VKVSVDGTGQVYSTDVCKASVDPKWSTHFDLFLSSKDNITVSVWNQKKVNKRHGGFLGCVKIAFATLQQLKDTGCEYFS
jgi:E3 ubiquitin ligase SMURF1/2